MSQPNSELFVPTPAGTKMPLRPSGTCLNRGQRWNGQNDGTDRHYRNNARGLSDSCAIKQGRSVVCGELTGEA